MSLLLAASLSLFTAVKIKHSQSYANIALGCWLRLVDCWQLGMSQCELAGCKLLVSSVHLESLVICSIMRWNCICSHCLMMEVVSTVWHNGLKSTTTTTRAHESWKDFLYLDCIWTKWHLLLRIHCSGSSPQNTKMYYLRQNIPLKLHQTHRMIFYFLFLILPLSRVDKLSTVPREAHALSIYSIFKVSFMN